MSGGNGGQASQGQGGARIALTGGTGFVGQALMDVALAQGNVVDALTRRPQPYRKGVNWTRGDLEDRDALAELVLGTEVVIHVAGVVNAPNLDDFARGNVSGTLAVLEAARAAGVRRFIFVSSLSAREPGLSRYGESKARAEQLVKASGLDWTIVRPPAIYGPRDREMLELFRAATWGVVPVPAKGHASLIHVEDLARLLLALIPGSEEASYHTFEPDDGRHANGLGGWEHGELAQAIGAAAGRRRVYALRLPKTLMQWAARMDMRLRGAKAKLTLDRVGYMAHPDWVVRPAARPPEALWLPQVETSAGLHATADWYQREGWL
jgi:nucleoside-diphosphate-sugar epimerase